jgi:hypothetical protein
MLTDFGQRLEDTMLSTQVGDAFRAAPEEITDYDYNVGETRRYKLGDTVQDQQFTPEQLQQLRLDLAADVYARKGRPEQALGLRSKAQQLKLLGAQEKAASQGLELGAVNLKNAKRKSDEDEKEQEAFRFLRSISHLPEPQKMQEIAKFASKFVPDGVNFGVDFDENAGYQMVAIGPNGSVSRKPVTDSRQLEREVLSYVNPKLHQQVRAEERQERTDDRLDRALGQQSAYQRGQLAISERNAATTERYRQDQAAHMERQDQRQAAMERRLGAGPQMNDLQRYQLEQQKLFDQERAAIAAAVQSGQMTEPEAMRRLNMLSVRFGGQMRDPQQQPRGLQGLRALGSTGLMTDGTKAYAYDDATKSFTEVKMPGQSAFDRYVGASSNVSAAEAADGLPSIKNPTNFRAGTPPAGKQRVKDPITGEMIFADEYRRKYGRNP